MKRQDQTDDVKVELYNLTKQFVWKYQPRLYMQYRGELDDLIMDFYCEFLTAKSRELGKEQTLLDKFDDSITTLPYLVKIAVQRKLIDASRSDKISNSTDSIENYTEEYGDMVLLAFDLIDGEDCFASDLITDLEFTEEEIKSAVHAFQKLTKSKQMELYQAFEEIKGVLDFRSPGYFELFNEVFKSVIPGEVKKSERIKELVVQVQDSDGVVVTCQVQQVTSKTICVAYLGTVVDFSRETGEGREKSYKNLRVIDFEKYTEYKSGKSRADFCRMQMHTASL